MNRLPEYLQDSLETERLYIPDEWDDRPVMEEIVASLNGEGDREVVELEIGGRVEIILSDHEWLMVEAMMEPDGPDRAVLYAELVNRAGDMEVTLDANPLTGEIQRLDVSHVNQMGRLGV